MSGVSRDEMTRFVRKLDVAFEIRDLTKLQLTLISCDQREISSDAMIVLVDFAPVWPQIFVINIHDDDEVWEISNNLGF